MTVTVVCYCVCDPRVLARMEETSILQLDSFPRFHLQVSRWMQLGRDSAPQVHMGSKWKEALISSEVCRTNKQKSQLPVPSVAGWRWTSQSSVIRYANCVLICLVFVLSRSIWSHCSTSFPSVYHFDYYYSRKSGFVGVGKVFSWRLDVWIHGTGTSM